MEGKKRTLVWLLALGAALVLMLVAAACVPAAPAPAPTPTPAKAAPPPAATPTPKPVALKKVKIAKSYGAAQTLAAFVADKEGYFKGEGLEVEFVRAPGTAGIAALAAGDLLLSDASGSALAATMEGAPFRVVWAGGRPTSHVWAHEPIRKVEDLVGKKAGCSSPGDYACRIMQLWLKQKGIKDAEKVITYIGVASGGERMAAVKSGAVDFAYVGAEHWVMLPEDGKGTINYLGSTDLDVLYGGFATSTVTIRDDRPTLKAAIKAMVKGLRYVLDPAKRDKVIKYAAEWASIPEDRAKLEVEAGISKIMWKTGYLEDQFIKLTLDIQKETMGLKPDFKFEPAQGFDFSFVKDAHKELDAAGWKP